ncbi:PhoD-like phosphatase N-terminal domain-containing protein [Natronococcus wangiae]|uniref:PhoD-like phosphatase N-terminal domain-containing protein n=1 Tax=Natronococcus wangiae TaxID=3068275 RepID=UPI00273FADAB|nr:PhoD-like phosphatase N-terminal domain-containing protein [Natronococcus sp. AD5]
MADDINLGGRDEPVRGDDDHAELLSELDSHDLAIATTPDTDTGTKRFEYDPDADPDTVFPQSVASGGPTPTGVILWTRIAPAAFDATALLAVRVARDSDFEEVVYEGVVADAEQIKSHDYTVKVDLDGSLESDREYYYRFYYRNTASRIGRCQTLPAPDASPEVMRFAVLAC